MNFIESYERGGYPKIDTYKIVKAFDMDPFVVWKIISKRIQEELDIEYIED